MYQRQQQDSDMEQLVYSSVMYAVGTRCGFDLSVQEQDFSQIVNIKDEAVSYTHLDVYKRQGRACNKTVRSRTE